MNSSKSFDIKKLCELIKNLHNHQRFNLHQQFGQIITNPLQLATLSILNLQINESVEILKHPHQNPPKYFERQTFVISEKLRKVGQMVKILSSLCKFKDPRQEYLANFQTESFYQQKSLVDEYPPRFLNFLMGIFPSINVHKENVPLYMPFYDKIESYHQNIGNPNWEISRINLDLIYRNEIVSPQEAEDNWYLLLTGNKKMLQIFNKSSIEEVWAYLYYFYVSSTLKPYKYVISTNQQSEQINLEKVIGVILDKLKAESDKEVSHLLRLILYVISDNTDQLKQCFKQFQGQLKAHVSYSQTNEQSRRIISEWGLTNAIYCQLLDNLTHNIVSEGYEDNTQFNKLQFMLDQSIELTEELTYKAIPYYDFYLRICYSSNTTDKDKLERARENILSVLRKALQKCIDVFPFPQYGYWQQAILQRFSTDYLQKYPNKIVDIANYLPTELAIWKLLNCEKLISPQQFDRISRQLIKNSETFMEEIQRTVNIQEQDYAEFLRIWRQFHDIIAEFSGQGDFQFQLQKAQKGGQRLYDAITTNINTEFRHKIYLPFNKSDNILKITNTLIQGYESILPTLNQTQRNQLLDAYLSILLNPTIKTDLITALNEEHATEFWKQWSLVYMTDQKLVNELINHNQPFDQESIQQPNDQRIEEEEERRDHFGYNHSVIMDLQ